MRSPVYRAPLDEGSDAWLDERWHALGGDDDHRDAGIMVEGRRIAVRARTRGMAWFDFAALCEGPRGSADYIEIATEFHTLLLGEIPAFEARSDDAARRFVTLIDELYDRHVNLVCTVDAAPAALYRGERLLGAFERTASRPIEMQGEDYLRGRTAAERAQRVGALRSLRRLRDRRLRLFAPRCARFCSSGCSAAAALSR